MRIAILPLVLAAAACAPTAAETARSERAAATTQQKLDIALKGLTPGEPQSCISQTLPIKRSTTYGSTILYRQNSRLVYRNDMGAVGCPGLDRDAIIVTNTPTTQLCRGDIAQLVDRTSRFPMGSCAFGDFVPYRRP